MLDMFKCAIPPVPPLSPNVKVSMETAFPRYSLASLRRIGVRLGLGKSSELAQCSREKLAPAIAASLQKPQLVYTLFQQLSPEQRTLLQSAATLGGIVHFIYLLKQYEVLAPPDPNPYRSSRDHRQAIVELLALGMFWVIEQSHDGTYFEFTVSYRDPVGALCLHPYVEAWLTQKPQASTFEERYEPHHIVGDAPTPLLHDINTLLQFCRIHSPHLVRKNQLSKKDRTALHKVLLGPPTGATTDNWLDFLWALIWSARLLLTQDGTTVLSNQASVYLTQSAPAQTLSLWLGWLKSDYNEFLTIVDLELKQPRRRFYTDIPDIDRVQRARKTVLTVLSSMEGWHGFKKLQKAVRLVDGSFLINHTYTYTSYSNSWNGYAGISDSEGRIPYEDGWERVEGRFIARLLTGPLLAFGAVLLDQATPSHAPMGFYITPAGQALLSQKEPPLTKTEGAAASVLPTGDVYVYPERCYPALLEQIRSFCTHIATDKVVHFRLEEQSVRQALQKGSQADSLKRILEEASDTPLPQNLQFLIDDCDRRCRRILVTTGVTYTKNDGDDTHTFDYSQSLPSISTSWKGKSLYLMITKEPDWEVQLLLRWLDAKQCTATQWAAQLSTWRPPSSLLDSEGFPICPQPAASFILGILVRRSSKPVPAAVRLAVTGWCDASSRRPILHPLLEIHAPSPEWLEDALSLPEAQACLVSHTDSTVIVDAKKANPFLERLAKEFGWSAIE